MIRQLAFDLPSAEAMTRDHFFVAPSNAVALQTVEHWHDWPGRKLLLVGPEGGWEPTERAGPVPSVALGPHVLRAETAAITAGALLSALRVRLVAEAGTGRDLATDGG